MNRIAGAAFVALLALAPPADAQQRSDTAITTIDPGEECPAGMTEIRPGRCRRPELDPPSIVDYRPRSTLVTEEHPVARARYTVVDFHGHPRRFASPEGLAELGAAMDSLNIRVMIVANNLTGDRLEETLAAIEASRAMRDRVRVMTGIDFEGVGSAGWVERTVASIEAAAEAGAVGIGEVGKGFGLTVEKPDGTRLRIDDPLLDPVWEAAARLGLPVFIHTADPAEFFQPLDHHNERWLELALFPHRRYPPEKYPSFEQLLEERNNLFRRHPETTFVTAHLGWQANDLGALGRLMDEAPNVYTEIGAVLYDIRAAAAGGPELLRSLPGPDPVRQGRLRAGGVPVLLAGAGDGRRVLRLLPGLPRLLEALWHRPAGRRAAEALLRERAPDPPGHAQQRLAGGVGVRRQRRAPLAHTRMIVILIGVSGAGKSTVGELLAADLGWSFYDGDRLHPLANIEKMRRGMPLTDEDRWPWLEALRDQIAAVAAEGRSAVVACSALKAAYRDVLLAGSGGARIVYLKGSYALIDERLRSRDDHFFDPALLATQFEVLEEPEDAIAVDVRQPPERVAAEIRRRLGLEEGAEDQDDREADQPR